MSHPQFTVSNVADLDPTAQWSCAFNLAKLSNWISRLHFHFLRSVHYQFSTQLDRHLFHVWQILPKHLIKRNYLYFSNTWQKQIQKHWLVESELSSAQGWLSNFALAELSIYGFPNFSPCTIPFFTVISKNTIWVVLIGWVVCESQKLVTELFQKFNWVGLLFLVWSNIMALNNFCYWHCVCVFFSESPRLSISTL